MMKRENSVLEKERNENIGHQARINELQHKLQQQELALARERDTREYAQELCIQNELLKQKIEKADSRRVEARIKIA